MEEAGLKKIEIQPDVEKLNFRSGKEMWKWVTNSNPIAVSLISELSEKQKIQVQQTLEDMVRERAGGNEVAILKAELHVAVGRKV